MPIIGIAETTSQKLGPKKISQSAHLSRGEQEMSRMGIVVGFVMIALGLAAPASADFSVGDVCEHRPGHQKSQLLARSILSYFSG